MIKNMSEVKRKIKENNKLEVVINSMHIHSLVRIERCLKEISVIENYNKVMQTTLHRIYNNKKLDIYEDLHLMANPDKRKLLVVLTSEKGFCGEFNSLINQRYQEIDEECHIIKIGTKFTIKPTDDLICGRDINLEDLIGNIDVLTAITNSILEVYLSGECSGISFLYNKYINATTYKTELFETLPKVSIPENDDEDFSDFEYELSNDELLKTCLGFSIFGLLYSIAINSFTSEVLQRNMITKGSKDKIEERAEELKVNKMKCRSAKITNETNDINNSMIQKRKGGDEDEW